ncbi:lung seven transmembrane receptor-domain-containing protein [Sphaerosporella brunnea]|uniref:Lung seven transmembrane receptor-domain-containing protein n=1 Tax=Sphaerosporella brunnea TaxID=1250544 RepID=A0A5J5FC32_9PEZI|nr:lung seven transmembrane receptor-domain-containing protein [Sphaerosporella brunnea]
MLRCRLLTAAALLFSSIAGANEFALSNGEEQQQCAGMYSKSSWGGTVDPGITVRLTPTESHNDIVSLVIFEFEDEPFLGRFTSPDDRREKSYICTPDMVTASMCEKGHEGEFVVAANTNTSSHGSIFTTAIHLADKKPIYYPIKRTGYYCVWAVPYTPNDLEFTGVVTFQNSYGELPASQIPKLAFYGGMTIVYAVIAALWAFLYVQHRRDILPVQNYITAIIIFLILEMAITWVFYDYENRHGTNALSKVLMTLVAVLNAGRNSFSFFLLLIVCMGYGVVKPSLGPLMKYVRILAVLHFVFGVVYAVASLTITPESAGPFVLLVIFPLATTLTAFYMWTLNSLKMTMKELEERKQHQKGLMYRRLWWCLLTSIFVIIGFLFLNSLTFAGHGSPDFGPKHWKMRWFVLDGWLNLVYLANICTIAYLWRPTANNRRFAMSDELAQDEDGGFEIASIGGGSELDEDEDEERKKDKDIEATAGLRPAESSSGSHAAPPSQQQHQAHDEPIFEVGGGDGWSDGEVMSSDEELDSGKKAKKAGETERLTGGGKKKD